MRVSEESRRQTRKRILHAATDLFRDGYAEATTRAIAAKSGIATGTLFNYFPSKEALGFGEMLAQSRRSGGRLSIHPGPVRHAAPCR